MKPNPKFIGKDSRFWSVVQMVSETVGYSARAKKGTPKTMKAYTTEDVLIAHEKLGIPLNFCFVSSRKPRKVTIDVLEYLNDRSHIIQHYVEKQLMNRKQARIEFEVLQSKFKHSRVKIQMNKQKGEKRHPSYLVGMVNLTAEGVLGYGNFDDDPMRMGLIVDENGPLKTLCRRMDGAYPSTFKPKVLWEVKEYYGTTTFGSRVADGVYETMLVGEELKRLSIEHGIKVHHVLFVDDYFTWWQLGRSYLCRLIDMLHVGYVDEIFFGKEVLTEWPKFLRKIK